MLLLGIDVGTTGAKAAVFDEDGNQRGYGFEEYGVNSPAPGYAEQDAEEVWNIAKRVIACATRQSGPDIRALSLSVQGDAVLPIDSTRRALAPVQLGMDYRARQECALCEKQFGSRHLFELTGMRPHPLNSLLKILWIKNHRPDLYERAWKFVTYADFLLAKLGSDEIVIDHTMASRTMAWDLRARKWSEEILDGLGIPEQKLARPVPSGTEVGTVSGTLAEELGIRPGARIVAGGHDQTCAALGAGITEEDVALDSHGTAEVVSAAFARPRLDDVMFRSYYPCYVHTVPGMFFTFALNHTGGILLKWFVENFCQSDRAEAERTGTRLYEYVVRAAKSGPSPLMVLPYFNGSGTPACDLGAKGAILGLTLSSTRYDVAKAILEALSFEMRVNLETLRGAGVKIAQLRCVGGGARSPVGLQNKADITGLPVSTLKVREAACLGAAILAGAAAGAYRSIREGAQVAVPDATYYPNAEAGRLYDEKYCIYAGLYDKMKQILHQL